MVQHAPSAVLVSTQWVADHLDDPGVRLVEAAYDGQHYARDGHIPGAVSWTYREAFQHPIRRDVPDQAGWEALLSRTGIDQTTTVVVYDVKGAGYAAFAFWLLKIYGHHDVRYLDGGVPKWAAEGRPLTVDVPVVTPTAYRAATADWSTRARRDDVLAAIGRADSTLLDVRAPAEYAGALMTVWRHPNEGAQRGGHIPGAVNVPWNEVLAADGTFKPADELRALYAERGITPEREVITYCVVGGRSGHSWFVLKHLLGFPRARFYDASWSEWGHLIGVPIEQ